MPGMRQVLPAPQFPDEQEDIGPVPPACRFASEILGCVCAVSFKF